MLNRDVKESFPVTGRRVGSFSSLKNISDFWDIRRGMNVAQENRFAECLLEVLAEKVTDDVWARSLAESTRRVKLFYPDDERP